MHDTYTSKPTSKRSKHTNCRIFWNFFHIKKKMLLDAQIREYNTKLSTKPNHKTNHKSIQMYQPQHHIYQINITTIHYH